MTETPDADRVNAYIQATEERPECEHERECLRDHGVHITCPQCDARAVIALADREQADKDAKIAELTAKVARVEALAKNASSVPVNAGGGNLVRSERMVSADDLRAALAGPAEPEAGETGGD